MRFANTVLESLTYVLPPEVLTSKALEAQLNPLYERLKLPEGRLELMTGIRERRFWPADHLPSAASAEAGRAALAQSRIAPESVDLLIHTGVCRDQLEPATASNVHRLLGLPETVQILDISNACLGFLNAMILVAGLIESGQIRSALLVSGENGKPLIEHTVRELNRGQLSRNAIKPYFANLTIGGGAVAGVLTHHSLAPDRPRLLGGVVGTDTASNDLCRGGNAADGFGLQMQTDSEALLEAGIGLARKTWARFLEDLHWRQETADRIITHQVGRAHRNRLYQDLGLDLSRDFSTFETMGNVGSVSLPLTLARAAEDGFVGAGHRVALLGIGSGLSCMMLGLEWR